jgi:ABC-2 type transport system permease protein
MTTLTAPARDAVSPPSTSSTSGAGFVTAATQSSRRTILQFLRTPQLLIMGTVQGALFLFMFRYIFGGAIDPGGGVDYVDFLIPGFLVTMILWIGMESPAGVAEDAASGVHDRLRSLPIPRAAVMIGRSLADTAFTAWGMLVATALAFAVGFRLDADLASVALAVALILVATYSFMWVFITIGLVSRSAQAAQAMATLFVIPLAFVSSAYVPADSLPSWMQPVAENQPFSVITNAVRSLTLGGTDAAGVGHTTAYWVALSLAWCAGILVVFGSLAVRRFARRR